MQKPPSVLADILKNVILQEFLRIIRIGTNFKAGSASKPNLRL
jgi:hypothetical protein